MGMTLLEVLVTAALFGVFITLVGGLLSSAQKTYEWGSIQEEMETRGRRLIDALQKELVDARATNVTTSHTILTYKIPVDWDGDGDVVDAGKLVEYGYIDPAANTPKLNWSAALMFVQKRTLSEAALGIDINGDNDTTDTLAQGSIDKVVYNSLGVEVYRVSMDDDVILVNAVKDADVDGHLAGVQDPLFYRTDNTGAEQPLTGNIVMINVWHGRSGDPGNYYIRRNNQRIYLRNSQ